MTTPPLQNSQQRWEQFFAQQGRQMPQVARPQPAPAAPAQQNQFANRPLLNRLSQQQTPPNNFFLNALWRRARQQAPQTPQMTQEVSREPLRGFFGSRGIS